MSDLVFKIGMTLAAVGWSLLVVGGLTGFMSPAIGGCMALGGFAMVMAYMISEMWMD